MHQPATAPDHGRPEGLFAPRLRGASAAIFTTVALSAFEGLAVAAALPQLAAELGQVSLLPWVITAYLLASGVATVAAGALVDRIGVAGVYRWAVASFVLGGVLAGVAPTMTTVVAARVVQGLGAGAVNAVSLAAVGLVYPPRLVSRAFAANTTVWGVMSVAGPALAAAMLTIASWRWIFLVNLPLGGLALAVGWRAMPALPPSEEGQVAEHIRLDPLVLALLTAITFCSLYALDALDLTSLPAIAVTVAAAAFLLRRERGRPGALIAPRHVVDAPLGPLAWGMALVLTGTIGLATYIPLYLTAGRGVAATTAAWSVIFFTLGWTSGANAVSRLVDRFPAVDVIRVAAGAVPLLLLVVAAAVASEAPLWLLLSAVTLTGTGVGGATNAGLTILRTVAPDSELGRATAAHQFVRNFGFAMGNALFGAVIIAVVAAATGEADSIRRVLGDAVAGEGGTAAAPAGGAAARAVADAVRTGVTTALVAGAAISAIAAVPLRRMAGAVAVSRQDGTAASPSATTRSGRGGGRSRRSSRR